MSIRKVIYKGHEFKVDTNGDHYGTEFWNHLEDRLWEPDTLDFLEREITSSTVLLDIGAANGSICLVGASLGAKVIAYEPNPTVFQVCKNNLVLNPNIDGRVELKLAAVSGYEGSLTFEAGKNSSVITDISVGLHSDSMTVIPVLNLSTELEHLSGAYKKLLVKMDIEGAEFEILHNEVVLKSLKKSGAKLLLAIHPGFYRPVKSFTFFKGIRNKIFILRNLLEAIKLFKEISNYAEIYRTNLNPVKSARIFGLLVIASYHEFIIDFSNHQ